MSGTGNFASVVSGSQPIDRDAKPTKSAFDTTAALAQENASNPGEARIMNKNAFVEKSAAEEAAERARLAGEKLTGKPEGDANADAVKKALNTTDVKFDQIHNDGTGVQHGAQSVAGKATEAAKGATEQASKTAQGALGAVQSTASSALNTAANTLGSVTSSASSTANTASNKASETANSASQTASQAANTASNKASETYNAASSTASSAANTASDKASQAANGASEAGSGILGSLSSTAGSVVNAATGTASSVLSAAQSFVGLGSNSQEGADMGVPKEGVQTGKEVPTKREGGDAHVTETAPAPLQ